jgi:hypothetical protein
MGKKMCTGFWWEHLKERDDLEELGVDVTTSEWFSNK